MLLHAFCRLACRRRASNVHVFFFGRLTSAGIAETSPPLQPRPPPSCSASFYATADSAAANSAACNSTASYSAASCSNGSDSVTPNSTAANCAASD